MKKLFFAIICVFTSIISYSQSYMRLAGETPENFVKRAFKIEELAHPVIETKEWDSTKTCLIYFIQFATNEAEGIVGYLLVPTNGGYYTRLLIDSFYREGGTAGINIASVFFANADRDKTRELVILTSAEAMSPRYADVDEEGTFYNTYIYDAPDLSSLPKRLLYLKELSEKFYGFNGSTYDSQNHRLTKKEQAKYKDARSIRLALKQLGY